MATIQTNQRVIVNRRVLKPKKDNQGHKIFRRLKRGQVLTQTGTILGGDRVELRDSVTNQLTYATRRQTRLCMK